MESTLQDLLDQGEAHKAERVNNISYEAIEKEIDILTRQEEVSLEIPQTMENRKGD